MVRFMGCLLLMAALGGATGVAAHEGSSGAADEPPLEMGQEAGRPALAPDTGFSWNPLSRWNVTVTPLGERHVRLSLSLGRLHLGGEGEARQEVQRLAEDLMRQGGYAGFELIRFSEGVASDWPLARRVAEAEVRLVKSRMWPEL